MLGEGGGVGEVLQWPEQIPEHHHVSQSNRHSTTGQRVAHIECISKQDGSGSREWRCRHASIRHRSYVSLFNLIDKSIVQLRWKLMKKARIVTRKSHQNFSFFFFKIKLALLGVEILSNKIPEGQPLRSCTSPCLHLKWRAFFVRAHRPSSEPRCY